jgi:hypothetical protein
MSEQTHDLLAQAAARGMSVAYHAAIDPGRMAIVSPAGRRNFGELNARVNRQGRAMQRLGLVQATLPIAPLVGRCNYRSNKAESIHFGQSLARSSSRK